MPTPPPRAHVPTGSVSTLPPYSSPPPSYKTSPSVESLPTYRQNTRTPAKERKLDRMGWIGLGLLTLCMVVIAVPLIVVSIVRPE